MSMVVYSLFFAFDRSAKDHCKTHLVFLELVRQDQVRLKLWKVPAYRLGKMKCVHVSSDIFFTGEECDLIYYDSDGN